MTLETGASLMSSMYRRMVHWLYTSNRLNNFWMSMDKYRFVLKQGWLLIELIITRICPQDVFYLTGQNLKLTEANTWIQKAGIVRKCSMPQVLETGHWHKTTRCCKRKINVGICHQYPHHILLNKHPLSNIITCFIAVIHLLAAYIW